MKHVYTSTHMDLLMEFKQSSRHKLCPNCGIVRQVERLENNPKKCNKRAMIMVLACALCHEKEQIGYLSNEMVN